jgi:ABC-type Fe3+/spermidine/putrescine transport system ATPase subunit
MEDDRRRDVSDAPRVEIRKLVKAYRREGGKSIIPVDHVDLTVAQNELLVLLGPSGCGKTTLLRCVAGLERPDEGEILIGGRTVFSSARGIFEPPDRRNLDMVFQSFALWPHMNVAANVGYPLRSRRVARAEIDKRVSDILELVGVAGLEEQYPGRISGGQQQRVALARALVAASTVVLFDEPLSNVDALVRAQLRFELKRMQARLGFSGLYVTHDQTEAMELGHRVAVLRSGRIAALGSPKEVYRNPPSEYVATFIGATNIWEGTVNGASERGIRVATTLGVIEARPPRSLPATGADVKLAARPEALRLAATRPEGAPNTVEVTVDETLFSGPHTEVVVTRGPVRVRVWVQGDEDIANSPRGRPLWLTMPVEDVSVFPASEA